MEATCESNSRARETERPPASPQGALREGRMQYRTHATDGSMSRPPRPDSLRRFSIGARRLCSNFTSFR
jgi:hypothetical protein